MSTEAVNIEAVGTADGTAAAGGRAAAGRRAFAAVAVLIASAVAYRYAVDYPSIVDVELGGSVQRPWPVTDPDALRWDLLLIAGYTASLSLLCSLGSRIFWTSRARQLARAATVASLAAAAADLGENAALYLAADRAAPEAAGLLCSSGRRRNREVQPAARRWSDRSNSAGGDGPAGLRHRKSGGARPQKDAGAAARIARIAAVAVAAPAAAAGRRRSAVLRTDDPRTAA